MLVPLSDNTDAAVARTMREQTETLRRLLLVAYVATACVIIMALATLFVGYKYWQVTSALDEIERIRNQPPVANPNAHPRPF